MWGFHRPDLFLQNCPQIMEEREILGIRRPVQHLRLVLMFHKRLTHIFSFKAASITQLDKASDVRDDCCLHWNFKEVCSIVYADASRLWSTQPPLICLFPLVHLNSTSSQSKQNSSEQTTVFSCSVVQFWHFFSHRRHLQLWGRLW